MALFNKVVEKTTMEIVDDTIIRLSSDVLALNDLKENALSSFRECANSLNGINEELKDKVATLDRLIKFASGEKSMAEKMMNDNESVRKKILDIIGE